MSRIIILINNQSKSDRDFITSYGSGYEVGHWDEQDALCVEVLSNGFEFSNFPSVVNLDEKITIVAPSDMTDALAQMDTIKEERLKTLRDELLNSSDKYKTSDYPKGSVTDQQIDDYRQALRDLPADANWPSVSIPTNPFE